MLGPVDAHGNSLAATNEMKAQLAEMTRTAPANVVTLENSGLKDTQELMDKWGRQDMQREMLQEIGRNPRAASAIAGLAASANNTEAEGVQGQDVAGGKMQCAVTPPFQVRILSRKPNNAARMSMPKRWLQSCAGNPLTNALTQAQIETERLSADKTRRQNDVLSQLNAKPTRSSAKR